MAYRIETTGDTVTAWLSGELDHHTAAQMREQVDAGCSDRVRKMLALAGMDRLKIIQG